MPLKLKYQKSNVKYKKRNNRKIALYTLLGLSTLAISAFLIQKSTYFAPSAREVNNLPQQKLEAEAYIKYLNQYGLIKDDIENYKLGTTNINVLAKAITNDKAYLPKLKLYINGITKPFYEVKSVPATNSFSPLEWNIPYVIKDGDEIAVEYFNDTEANREKTVYIGNIEINGRKYYITSADNRVWYDRSNRDDSTKYGDQNDFGNSFDNKEVLRFGDYLNFKIGGFNGDMYWNGAIHVQYRAEQNTYPQYKSEYLSDKNKNRFFDDSGVITRNEKGSCKLNNGKVTCSELDFDWKFSSPDDRYDRIPGDFFLARYTRDKLFFPGKYKFSFLVDDGVRFYLDNKLLIDKYNVESKPRLSEVTTDLTKGNHNLRIEFLENTEEASLKINIIPISIDTTNLTEDEKLELMYLPYESYNELDDSDGDGLLNIFEMSQMQLGTKPNLFDTDGNGVSDAYEDTDNDGLLNILEQKYHTNPLQPDTDSDRLDDVDEIYKHKTNPLKYDSDFDGLSDGFEVNHDLNPNSKDSNNNGINDANEIITFNKADDITGTQVTVTGEAILSEELKFEEQNPAYTAGGAEKTMLKIVDVVNPNKREVQNVKVSLSYDDEVISKTKSKTPDKLKIVYLNDQANNITPLDNQNIDKTQKTVSGLVTHLSMFVLIDQDTWDEIFANEFIPSIRGSNGKLNVVFSIDDSTSMLDYDPLGNRIKAPNEIVDGLKIDDKAGIIIFADAPNVLSDLTSNKLAIKNLLNPINLKYNGETNMAKAIRRGVELLRGAGSDETARVLITLTDGILDDQKTLEDQVDLAKEHNVIIYTIGLGDGVDDNLLKNVAQETGGKYYKIQNSGQILDVYGDIRSQGKDTDGDGLPDTLELKGIRTCTKGFIKTNPNKADTDGDGLTDGFEAGAFYSNSYNGGCYVIVSDPNKPDTDHDGVDDKTEIENRTSKTIFDESVTKGKLPEYSANYLIVDLNSPDKVCFKPQIAMNNKIGEKNTDGSLKKDFTAKYFSELIKDHNANLNGFKPRAAFNTDFFDEKSAPRDINFVQGYDYSGERRWSSMAISKNNQIQFVTDIPKGPYNVSGGGPKIVSNGNFENPCISETDNKLGDKPCGFGDYKFQKLIRFSRTLVGITSKNYMIALVSSYIDPGNLGLSLQTVAINNDLGNVVIANMFDGGGSPSMFYDFDKNGVVDNSDVIKNSINPISSALMIFEGESCKFR